MFCLKIKLFALLVFLICSFQNTKSLKVLMYQTAFSPSHVSFSGALAEALIQRGHIVDKVILLYNDVNFNGSTNLRNVFRVKTPPGQNPFLKLKHISAPFDSFVFQRREEGFEDTKKMLCETLITDSNLLNHLKSQNYDIYVTAAYEGCAYGLFHLLQIPSMVGFSAVSSMDGMFEMLGIPVPPSFISSVMRSQPGEHDQLNFKRRVQNFLEALENAVYPSLMKTEQALFENYYPGFPRLQAVGSKMSFLFLNTDEILDMNKPTSSKVKFVGGIAMKKLKQLDIDAERVLSLPSKGVILFSFGSLVKTFQMPFTSKIAILEAFKEFPEYNFLWKFDDIEDDADIFMNTSNVLTRKWLQQTEMLYDPRVKLFITHMGLNSYLELSHAGVPAIAIPILGDQFHNTGCAVKNGVALQLDKTRLTKGAVVKVLKEMLTNPSYTFKAKQIAQMLATKPEKIDAEKFTDYVEYAAKFPVLGSEILQMASAEMSVYKYACVDVILFLLTCVLVMLGLIILVVRRVAPCLIRLAKNSSSKIKTY